MLMERTSTAVIEAVASKEGVPVTVLSPPLFEAVDCDALDTLYRSHSGDASTFPSVKFEYKDYHVTVNSPQDIEVELASSPR
jgi:hypothetical protein